MQSGLGGWANQGSGQPKLCAERDDDESAEANRDDTVQA